jgi:formylglycine-generating enzyme required for sulfatase activity
VARVAEVDKQLEGRLFQLLEDEARIRLGQLVLLRRRSRSAGITLLHAALNAGLVDPGVARKLATRAGLPGPTSAPGEVEGGADVGLESADLEPVTAEKPPPALPVLRPPPLPPREELPRARVVAPVVGPVVGRPIEGRRKTPPLEDLDDEGVRPPGPRRTLDIVPPLNRAPGGSLISPEDETGPFDAIDDGFEEDDAPPISIRNRRTEREAPKPSVRELRTEREAPDASWRDTEPPRTATTSDGSVDLPDLPDAADRYVLGMELGRGGMGQVLAAEDVTLDRPVALKLLFDQDDPALCARFVDEARVTGQLQHPSVPPVYELGRLGDGRLFFAMKRIEGRTLRDVLEDLRDARPEALKSFGRVRLLSVFARICHTIAYAHSRGVMHRDLKPENIMLGEFGEITVMDWGLAKAFDRPERPAPAPRVTRGRFTTQAGDVTGTPHYMAPEQAAGDVSALGPHTDVYSLGAVLYELLTLEPPFDGPDGKSIRALVLETDVVPPGKRVAEVLAAGAPETAALRPPPPEIEALCLSCLAKDPTDRPISAAWLAERIEQFLEGEQDRARKAAERERLCAIGAAAAEAFRRGDEEHQKLRTRAALARARVAPGAPEAMRRKLWELEDAAEAAGLAASRALSDALAAWHAALGVDGDHPSTREALAELYFAAFLAAEQAGDRARMAHYERLVTAFDVGGRYTAELKGDGQLELGRLPDGLKATLYTWQEDDRVLRPAKAQALPQLIHLDPVPMGSYLIEIQGPSLSPVRIPLYIGRRERVRLRLRLFPDHIVGAGFVHISGGPARLGGDPQAQLARPSEVIEVKDFFLAREAVTCAQYLAFLHDLAKTDRHAALARAPRGGPKGPPLWPQNSDGHLRIPEVDPQGQRWHPEWPIVSISAQDATAYCVWLGDRHNDRFRLPTDIEWEKAARGADGRLFPWGDRWEASFCHMGISREGPPNPDPGEGFPHDVSPYGIRGMAGGASEWTASWLDEAQERRVVKGGHWASSPVECRAASRFGHLAWQVLPTVGFRIARDAPG